jgi:hypothetical protein
MTSKPITPEQMARSGSEDGHQLAVCLWAAYNLNKYPELKWLHHSPNGGFRNQREAAKLKAMGVKQGFQDLILIVRRKQYNGLAIELKKLKGSVISSEQEDWKNHLSSEGYYATVCYGWIEAVAVIETYLKLER